MALILLVIGILAILVGGFFFWLNLNTPVQTCLPAISFLVGGVLTVFALGGLLL